MAKKILSLKMERKKDANLKAGVIKDESERDPKKRFLNGVAIHPSPRICLELGSRQPSMRAMDLSTPFGMG